MRTSVAVAVLLGACMGWTQPASADCSSPVRRVLWSYPSAGAHDVPVNAEFWALVSGWSAPIRVQLNGTDVDVVSVGLGGIHVAPGPLLPRQAYTLRLEYAALDPAPNEVFEIPFTTADSDSPAVAARAPLVLRIAGSATRPEDSNCGELIEAQDCFDTGQDTLLRFEAVGLDAEGWVVERDGWSVLWPARCDGPRLFTLQPRTRTCYDVRLIARGGLVSEPTRHCYDPDAPPRGHSTGPDSDAGVSPKPDAGGVADSDAGGSTQDEPDAGVSSPRPRRSAESGCALSRPLDSSHVTWLWVLGLCALGRFTRRRK